MVKSKIQFCVEYVCKDNLETVFLMYNTQHVNMPEIFNCVLTVWAALKHTVYLELEHMFSSHRLFV